MKRNIEQDGDAVIMDAGNLAGVGSNGSTMVQEVMGAGTPEVDSMTSRMWLSNQHAGTIIGKGGANIKQIREESATRVQIAEAAQQGAERLVTVIGPPLSVNRAVELMLDKIEGATDLHRAAEPGGLTAATPHAHTLKLCLSHNQVGAVIGKGGATIKSLREGSGANIKVEEPLVTITGGRAEVVKAHQLTVLKLATVPEEAPPNHPSKYQRTALQPSASPSGPYYGAMAAGYSMAPPTYSQPPVSGYSQQTTYGAAGYTPSPYGQQGQQPRGALPPPIGTAQGMSAGGYYAPQSGYGSPAQPQQGAAYSRAPGAPQYSAGAYQPQSGYAFATSPYEATAPGSGGAGSIGMAQPTGGPDGEVVQLVPSTLAGRLIGKGGSGIRELRDVSRANIKILSECEPGTDQRKVTISGAPDAISLALSMINQRLAQGP